MMLVASPFAASTGAAGPHWVIDPSKPGTDRPHAGASLFDRITATGDGATQIPFPFERLIARIEAAAGCDESDPCTRAVLIPLGRSLQRVAASPDFFDHPRAVAAVVAEGKGLLLRDRLFVGFQEKSGILEVISYNEAEGRFEFQVVRNYAPGRTPDVSYARRTVCISCHQNHGPVFSQPVWLETNANPPVADRLRERRESFFGIPARGTSDIAQSIDDATDRASQLALAQRLWRDGCGVGPAGEQCRRAALTASIQFALSGQRSYERSADFVRNVSQRLALAARTAWPGGLALPGADIPNRDPLDVHEGVTALRAADIATAFDPLVPRPPVEVVTVGSEDRLVRGVADFWPARSRAALADALEHRPAPVVRTVMPCRVSGSGGAEQFECATANARVRGALQQDGGMLDEVAIGSAESVRHLQMTSFRRQSGAATAQARTHGRRARLANGDAIERIALRWRGETGEMSMDIRQDFSSVAPIVATLPTGAGPLSSSLIEVVTARLNGAAIPVSRDAPFTAAVDAYAPESAQSDSLARQFESQCGSCHHTAERTPPNFLSGDAKRVSSALASCAPRIYVRLAMRRLPAHQRVKSPMPPELAGANAQAVQSHTADERALVELQAAVGAALRREDGRAPDLDQLLRHGYESLRPCLPAAETREAHHGRADS